MIFSLEAFLGLLFGLGDLSSDSLFGGFSLSLFFSLLFSLDLLEMGLKGFLGSFVGSLFLSLDTLDLGLSPCGLLLCGFSLLALLFSLLGHHSVPFG